MRIFISYTTRDHRDSELARRIHDGLKARAVDVFFAPQSIRSGAEWKEVLRSEISSRCTHFLIILSAAALDSNEVREEIDLAVARYEGDRAFRIMPLVTGNDVEGDPLSPRFDRVDYAHDIHEQMDIIAADLGLPRRRLACQRAGDLGDLAPRLCDRTEQESFFNSALFRCHRARKRIPQIYFISGAEGEKHTSLVERFRRTSILDLAREIDRDASVPSIDIPWPRSRTLEDASVELLAELFGAFDGSYRISSERPLTPADFRQLTAGSPPVVVVQHEIRSQQWSGVTARVLGRYLQFWNDVALAGPATQFVIFLNLVLCDSDEHNAEALEEFVDSLTEDEPEERTPFWKRLRRTLLGSSDMPRAPLPKNVEVIRLPSLQSVRREDVDQWFDDRKLRTEFAKRQRLCDELFSTARFRRMADVERRLDAFLFEHHLAEGRA